jgi:hypothetical protein
MFIPYLKILTETYAGSNCTELVEPTPRVTMRIEVVSKFPVFNGEALPLLAKSFPEQSAPHP